MKEAELKKKLIEQGYVISNAKRVYGTIKKIKKGLREVKKLVPLKEPILYLHRRNGRVEVHEGANGNRFIFTHTSGETRYVELRPSDIEVYDYFGNMVRGYDVHEDRPFAGWENPEVDNESYIRTIEMSKQNRLEYEASLLKAQAKVRLTWLWIIGGIILAIGATIALIGLFFPEFFDKIFGALSGGGSNIPPSL